MTLRRWIHRHPSANGKKNLVLTSLVRLELRDTINLTARKKPGSGIFTAFILNILEGHLEGENTGKASHSPTNYHRIAEAFKHAYAHRTKLGDPCFVPEVNQVR